MVIWIIGLSGSGKTYTANNLENILKKNYRTIIVDGDEVRKYLTYDLGYSIRDRKKNSKKIQDLSLYLESLGFLVIVPILSLFNEHQIINRKIFKKYFQIYIKADLETLKKKDIKEIYKKKKNIVGKDIKFNTPVKSNVVLINKFDKKLYSNIEKVAKTIHGRIQKTIK